MVCDRHWQTSLSKFSVSRRKFLKKSDKTGAHHHVHTEPVPLLPHDYDYRIDSISLRIWNSFVPKFDGSCATNLSVTKRATGAVNKRPHFSAFFNLDHGWNVWPDKLVSKRQPGYAQWECHSAARVTQWRWQATGSNLRSKNWNNSSNLLPWVHPNTFDCSTKRA